MKRKGVIAGLLLCLILTGCTKNDIANNNEKEVETLEESGDSTEFPEKYTANFDNVRFDTKITVSAKIQEEGMKQITVSEQEIDEDGAVQCLLEGKDIKNHDKNEETSWYEGTNGEILTISKHSLGYSTNYFVYVSNAFRIQQSYSDYNADKYSLDTDLKFKTRQEAFDDIKGKLNNMGISVGEEYSCYALDYETMKEEEYATDINGDEATDTYKGEWTEDDDAYYFLINQEYEDIPLYHVFYDAFPLAIEENSPIQVLYNKDGIQFLQIERMFNINKLSGTYELKSFDDVAEVIQNKYGMLLGNSTYEVTTAKMYYMADKQADDQYRVIPVWIFNTVEESTGKVLQDIVNAETLEEIVWEEK